MKYIYHLNRNVFLYPTTVHKVSLNISDINSEDYEYIRKLCVENYFILYYDWSFFVTTHTAMCTKMCVCVYPFCVGVY